MSIYMNARTYELFVNPDNYNEDNYIALDPEIAAIIATLNSKNYKTLFCCSGHPTVYNKSYKDPNDGHIMEWVLISDDSIYPESAPDSFYIMFDGNLVEWFKMHNIPDMFKIEYNYSFEWENGNKSSFNESTTIRLSKKYIEENKYGISSFYDSFDVLKDIHKKLYYWVERLPIYDGDNRNNKKEVEYCD